MEEENLSSLAQFNTALFMRFNQWLKLHYMSDTKQANNMCRISNTLYKILNMGTNNYFSDLPQQPIQLETSLWDWWGANKQGALERQNGPDDHSIPIGLWKSILSPLGCVCTILNGGIVPTWEFKAVTPSDAKIL